MKEPERRSIFSYVPDLGHWEESPTYMMSRREPRPVVVVHGTVGGRGNFNRLVPYLRSTYDGRTRRVFSVSYGDNGTKALNGSIEEIEDQLLELHELTRSPTFDLVAHSQGGLLSLAVASRPRAGRFVHHIVGLGADFRGVRMPWSGRPSGDAALRIVDALAGPAFAQQIVGSPELTAVLHQTATCTVPVTQIATKYDRTVPLEAAFALADDNEWTGTPAHPGPLRLILVQRYYPDLEVAHNMLVRNRKVAGLVKHALEHPPQRKAAQQ